MRTKKQLWIRALIICGVAAVLFAAALLILRNQDQARHAETREKMSEGFGQLRTVEVDGATYREKPAVTTLLLVGIDQPADTVKTNVSKSYRSGGQADFILLLAIDHTDRKIHQLQIDRDTMTEVDVLGVFGNEVGTRILQICLAHSFGETPQDNAKYTVRAVQNLMDGIDIDGYYMVDYSAVPTLNDALGGVTVELRDDMTGVNPAWTKGSTVTLRGKEAETFVRTRKTVGSGTNEERMDRQNEFMRKAVQQMRKKMSGSTAFAEELLNTLHNISVSNMTVKALAEEIVKARDYEVLPVDHPLGEYGLGDDGFVEFHMEKGETVHWVLEHLYTRR